jgi:hypothetical protein
MLQGIKHDSRAQSAKHALDEVRSKLGKLEAQFEADFKQRVTEAATETIPPPADSGQSLNFPAA